MDDSERRSLILVNPGLAPQARHRQHDVHGLPAERRQRDHAAAPAFAERDPLRPDRQGQFHRRRRRGHHLRPGRHGADADRHLAQPRHRRQRAGASTSRCSTCRWSRRSTPSTSSTTTARRSTASWSSRRSSRPPRFPSDYSQRIYGYGGLMPRFVKHNRGAGVTSPMYRLSLGDDARAARAAQGLGRRPATRR